MTHRLQDKFYLALGYLYNALVHVFFRQYVIRKSTGCRACYQVMNGFLFALRSECNRESEGHVYVIPSYLAVLWDRGVGDNWTFANVCITLSVFYSVLHRIGLTVVKVH